ncbi:hypothetical protein HPB50_016288 [Hyalomma asiaticum]|uniref:Uncharacterized protein n=1 Tax=Hyalomma asiaticum TaxID=266040 RepID=A0ACB7RRC0_HYAAI|nr:hypothetical protein HPB50_016288 [Hyalomma asiaticum]
MSQDWLKGNVRLALWKNSTLQGKPLIQRWAEQSAAHMEAPKPTHAYVEYKDGDKAIVSVRLIKYYRPKDVDDLARNKLVYWRKSSKGYMSEDYYRGDIVMLAYVQALCTRNIGER